MGPTIALIIALGCFVLLGFILRRAGQKGQAKGINIASGTNGFVESSVEPAYSPVPVP